MKIRRDARLRCALTEALSEGYNRTQIAMLTGNDPQVPTKPVTTSPPAPVTKISMQATVQNTEIVHGVHGHVR